MSTDKSEFKVNYLLNENYIDYIINGMYDWVRVIDLNDTIIFVNDAMSNSFDINPVGYKCYTSLGKDSPCENCTSRRTILEGVPHHKEEIIGNRIFSVMSSPIKDGSGKMIAVVEVLRDITETKTLQQKILEQNKKLQSELNIARKLQYNLLPKQLSWSNFDFSYRYKPCDTLGGDFLDIFKIDEEHIGVYIADVSGHGVAASMLTVFLRASINKSTLSPSYALESLFKDFNRDYSDLDLYITVFYAIIDIKNHSIIYSNAGHNIPPVLFNYNNKFELLKVSGIPISNWMENPSYKNKTLALTKGDRIFLCTDGIVELKNDKNEQYGEERLIETLLYKQSSPSDTLDTIIEEASKFSSSLNLTEILDDITMILLEIK